MGNPRVQAATAYVSSYQYLDSHFVLVKGLLATAHILSRELVAAINMGSLGDLEQQLAVSLNDLEQCQEVLAEDPTDASVSELVQELETQIAQLKSRIAAYRSSSTQHSSPQIDLSNSTDAIPPPPPPASNSLPAASRPSDADTPPPPPSDPTHVAFNVGDTILAKFSQDKQFYQAKVISKTGSAADPVYYVHFIGYPDKENKRNHEVRAIDSRKRKADNAAAASAAVPPPPRIPSVAVQNGAVISAAPSLEPPQPARHVPSLVSDGPTRMAPEPKKLKPNKKLEKAASSWQSFQKTGPKNPVSGLSKKQMGKDSMFRTSNLPGAKGK